MFLHGADKYIRAALMLLLKIGEEYCLLTMHVLSAMVVMLQALKRGESAAFVFDICSLFREKMNK